LLTIDPAKRWTAQQILASEFLNDMSVRVLKFLASIVEKDDRSKAEFFKGLQTALPHFPLAVVEKKVRADPVDRFLIIVFNITI